MPNLPLLFPAKSVYLTPIPSESVLATLQKTAFPLTKFAFPLTYWINSSRSAKGKKTLFIPFGTHLHRIFVTLQRISGNMTIKGLWARYKAWCKDPFRYVVANATISFT